MTFKEESGDTDKQDEGPRVLIATGTAATALAAICCATPVLGVVLGALGLTAWLVEAHYALIPIFLGGLGLLGLGLYRRGFA